ncbi:MAG: polyprenyl synthetase family protein [Alphaproteobacteria bacterium]|nr:MAG: polyprenyl synthetase family protein [Alphaproteobacteria bacterium]
MKAQRTQTETGHQKDLLHRIHTTYACELAALNDVLHTTLESVSPHVPEIARYVIRSGGKRIRPTLSILARHVFAPDEDRSEHLSYLAAGIECIHTATLLHDDVVDDSTLRRGQPSAHTVWGNAFSVLVGDFLLARSFALVTRLDSLAIVKTLSVAAGYLAEGEVLQLSNHSNLTMSQDVYITIIESKTARLFAAALASGAMLMSAHAEQVEALSLYGRALGVLFQLIDDSLDYLTPSDILGKGQGDDFHEGKVTLPVLLAYQRATPQERAFWERIFCYKEQKPDDFITALAYMQNHRVFDTIKGICARYADTSKRLLANLPSGQARDYLYEMVDYCLFREK